MHRIFRVKAYEKEHGPHFNEEYARKAVMKMENEDGTRGPHWSLEETTTLASQYGIALGSKFNRYDWFVALNMVYSDYYRVIMNITGSNNTKHYVEFAKAWLNDKDIDEGKMWYYYVYVMCDHIREAEMECYEEKMSKYEDEEEDFGHYRRGGRRTGMFGRRSMYDKDDYEKRDYERVEQEYDPYKMLLLLVLIVCYLIIQLNLMFLVLKLMLRLRSSMISSVNLRCVKCKTRLTLFARKTISQLCQLLNRLKQLILLAS